MKKLNMLAVVSAATLAVASASANAAIVVVTYTGIVSSGFDTTGVFGAANTDLSGKAFTATYRFDNSKGIITDTATVQEALGGSSWGAESPGLGAVLTIGGTAFAIDGQDFGQIAAQTFAGGFSGQTSQQNEFSIGTKLVSYQLYNFASGVGSGLPASNEGPFSGSLAGINSQGAFDLYEFDFTTFAEPVVAKGSLIGQTLTIGLESAVPEPATWAMMIGGFALAGAAMRRRQSAVSFA